MTNFRISLKDGFNGLFMKAEEFELEQNYHKRMRRLHNRYLHTWGIVWGLDINKSTKAGALPSDVTVTEGMALNKVAEGGEELSKEIILTEDRDVSLAAYGAGKGIYIYISYEEKPVKKDEKDIEETYRVEEAKLGSETDRSKIIESESIILGKVTLVDKNGTLTVDKIEFEEGGKSLRRYAGPSGKSLETDRITLAIAGVASDFPTIEGKAIGSDNGISIDSPRTIFSGALSVKGMLDAGGNISLPDNAGLVLGTTNAVNLHGNKEAPEVWVEATNQASAALVIGTAFEYDRQVRIKYTPGAEGAASGELLIGQDAKSVGTFTHGITSLLTNGAKRLTIDAAGNVTVLTGNLRIPNNDTFLDFGSDTRQMINLYGNGPNAAYGIGIQGWTMYSRSAGNFAWYIGGAHSDAEMDPGGGTPALVIKRGTGNVGIGTPNPSGKLQIYDGKYGSLGFGGNTEDLWFDGGADSIFWFKNIGGPTGRTSFVTGTTELMTVLNKGNVGIGTATPGTKLEVNLQNPQGWGGPLEAVRINSPDNRYWMDLRTIVVASGNVGYSFRTRNEAGAIADALTIDTFGKVGIGTTSPLYCLHVKNSGGFGGENADGTSVAGNVPLVLQSDSTVFGILNSSSRQAFALNIEGNGGTTSARGYPVFYDKYDGNWRSSIYLRNGTVGVGTAGPADKLDVAGNLRILTGSNPIRFTAGWTGFPDPVTNQAEISNDTGTYKTLMIVGNKSGGLGRRVSIWDRLEVNGSQKITGRLGTNGYDPDSGYPGGWGGGINTWDIVVHGTGRAVSGWQTGNWDLAEKFEKYDESLEPGDVVVADTSSSERLIKSTDPYQDNLLGVISEKPGFLLGVNWEDPQYPIALALAGRVKVKVSMEGGPVREGDYLTSSSEESYAMKANRPGRVIGIALESFDGSQGSKGKVVVFVNPHWWGGYNRSNT